MENCKPYNYKNETQQSKTQTVENGKIVDKWVNTKVDGKTQYRDTIIINFIAEDGKAIPNSLSLDNLKAMSKEHSKLLIAKDDKGNLMPYRKTYQFPEPLEQVDENDVTTVTIGAKYEPIRPTFRSALTF